jgi:hypothetical protein
LKAEALDRALGEVFLEEAVDLSWDRLHDDVIKYIKHCNYI